MVRLRHRVGGVTRVLAAALIAVGLVLPATQRPRPMGEIVHLRSVLAPALDSKPAAGAGSGTVGSNASIDLMVGPASHEISVYQAPLLSRPLVNLDPGLASRGPRPSLAQLIHSYQYGNPAVILARTRTPTRTDWRLSRPDPAAVAGYASEISVLPGAVLHIHLAGRDRWANLDAFRIGRGDARHVLSLSHVAIPRVRHAARRSPTGLVQERWPIAAALRVGANWASGVYLIKLTGTSGGQSYILFVVRPVRPGALTVVIPTMTYQAYNAYGGASLYRWPGASQGRAFAVSFDRPFDQQFGAGGFFHYDFPLVVWLEDHGYAADYVADVDLARDPTLLQNVRTLGFSGHGEYWTQSMRDQVDAAARRGTNLAFFGANQAFWQVRLTADAAGVPDRQLICYKDATLDPLAAVDPANATVRFDDPAIGRPSAALIGEGYGGILSSLRPLTVGPDLAQFAPDVGLVAGQRLPGLIGEEVDQLPPSFNGLSLGLTPVSVMEHPGRILVGTSVWVNPMGSRVFDAGTFDYAWGLDPRYAAALPGFPAQAFSALTARILGWLGAQPSA